MHRVAGQGTKLAVFPESFIGGHPKGQSFGSVVGNRGASGRDLYNEYFEGAVTLGGAELAIFADCVVAVMGIIERLGRTSYCTAVTFIPGQERIIWEFGDGSTIEAIPTDIGVLGNVICWENYMAALRQAMYAQDVQFYRAPTADDRKGWEVQW